MQTQIVQFHLAKYLHFLTKFMLFKDPLYKSFHILNLFFPQCNITQKKKSLFSEIFFCSPVMHNNQSSFLKTSGLGTRAQYQAWVGPVPSLPIIYVWAYEGRASPWAEEKSQSKGQTVRDQIQYHTQVGWLGVSLPVQLYRPGMKFFAQFAVVTQHSIFASAEIITTKNKKNGAYSLQS